MRLLLRRTLHGRFRAALLWPALLLIGDLGARASVLELQIRHTFKGDPVLLDSLRYENAAKETLSISRLSYLLSGFAVERSEGGWVEVPDLIAWIDVERHRTAIRLPNLPTGHYRALRFNVGLDPVTNAADPAKWAPDHPLNPNLDGLHWSWQGGYIFLAFEGHFRVGAGDLKGFAYHLARDPNRTRINLTAPLDLTHDVGVLLDLDLGALLNAPRPLAFEKDGTATHSREGDPVASALIANLPAAWSVRQVVSSVPEVSVHSVVKPLYLPSKYTPYRFTLKKTFPIPDLPRDNPLLEERVALGRKLFNEKALSRDNSIACASCHQPGSGFSDPRPLSVGVRGQLGSRHSMPLMNLAWKSSFFWDGRAPSLRAQALVPIQDHKEMDETPERIIAKLSKNGDYPGLFQSAFGSPEITAEKIGLALENFVLTLVSCNSKFDQAMAGKVKLTEEEQRGFQLFMTEYEPRTGQRGADCFHCHGGALFSDHQFHNNGLKPMGDDSGRFRITGNEADRDKFSTPSLRNVALRGPYMHDGRFSTLEEVVRHYNSGVQASATLDPNLAKHPADGLHLSEEEIKALVAFLRTLTDEGFSKEAGDR